MDRSVRTQPVLVEAVAAARIVLRMRGCSLEVEAARKSAGTSSNHRFHRLNRYEQAFGSMKAE